MGVNITFVRAGMYVHTHVGSIGRPALATASLHRRVPCLRLLQWSTGLQASEEAIGSSRAALNSPELASCRSRHTHKNNQVPCVPQHGGARPSDLTPQPIT